jgi:tricorn protease
MWHKVLCGFLLASALLAEGPYLFRKPTLSKTQIAFSFAGDLWIVSRAGGEAVRLTSGPGIETDPKFSPDGSQIALSGEYDGNIDVFVMPSSGGVPKRLTYHPSADLAVGWTADGKQVLFRSPRSNPNGLPRLFAVTPEGGFPAEYPLPTVADASFSADGSQVAYVPLESAFGAWKRYRGGRAMPIWLARLSDSSVTKLPRTDSNDFNPMWIGNRVYFLSDRNGPVTLFYYDANSKKVTQLIENHGLDIKSASAGPGAIVYEQFGSLNLYDLKTGKAQKVEVTLNGDLPGVRPRLEKAARSIRSFALSPSGVRAVFEARGEIFTVPAEKGDVRNITRSPGVADRDPSWSPDGKWIAYFSDESGEYELHLRDQTGMGDVKKIGLGSPPSFYYSPVWSPDSKKIAYVDKRTNLWYVELEKKTPVRIDNGTYSNSYEILNPHWSPDSRWITYVKQLKNRLGAVKLYSLETGQSTQITDGMSDAQEACFDQGGKYLYFVASTDSGPSSFGLDMSSTNRPVTRSVYVAVLRKDLPSPLAPESDEEKVAAEKKEEKKDEKKEDKKEEKPNAGKLVNIDLENIGQRILPLPLPARNYPRLVPGKEGILFIFETPSIPAESAGPASRILHKFDLSKRKAEKFLDGINVFDVSHNGEKIIYRQDTRWTISPTSAPPKPGEGTLKMDEIELFVDPKAEWKQMYKEAWRIERDFFYDPHYHGLDLQASEERYQKFLTNLGSRADLNYLFQEMLGELSVGHLYVQGGDVPQAGKVKGGLLGADYKIENGRYRFARVYNGENWNPQTRAPLTQPGVNVPVGEYLLAVNGRDLRGSDEIYSFFEGTAGKSVVLRVGSDPAGAGARDVTVVPVENETSLRTLAWMEDNRRKVDQMSGGRLAYIHLPDTGGLGYTYFNRYYFAQVDKQGAVIDERFNRAGQAADYIIDNLRRTLLNYWTPRDGADDSTPAMAIFGPKVMIINEYAGSGGDLLPWYFRRTNTGTLIGKRTWGGLVGIGGYPRLIDGGSVTAPHFAFWNPDGKWEVENHGTDPDIEVEFDPKAWREGKDPQLEKAVQVALEALEKNPAPVHKKPAYPVYHKPAGIATGSK